MESSSPRGGALRLVQAVMARLNDLAVTISSAALVIMAFMITADVILRFLFNAPLPASVEVSQLLQPYVVLLPMAYTLAVGQHVRVTIVTNLLPPAARGACEILTYVLDFILFSIVAYYGWTEFAHSLAIREVMFAAIELPWWVGKFALPAGMIVLTIQCLVQISLTVQRICDTGFGAVDLKAQAREGV